MCQPASFVVVPGKAYWSPESDSHIDIVSYWRNKGVILDGASVELSPPYGNFLAPLDTWRFRMDERIPDLTDTEAERLAKEELIQWMQMRVIPGGSETVTGARKVFVYDANVRLLDSVEAVLTRSVAELSGNAYASLYDGTASLFVDSSVRAGGTAEILAGDRSRVLAYGTSKIVCQGRSFAEIYDKVSLVLRNRATGVAHGGTVIMHENAVLDAWCNTQVEVHDSAVVHAYCEAQIDLHAGVVFRYEPNVTVNLVGTDSSKMCVIDRLRQ